MADYDVTVIGGGLIGCASACYLARGGARVALLERGQINQGASGQNAGSLHFQLEYRLIRDIDRYRRELEFYVGMSRHAIMMWEGLDEDLGIDTQTGMHGGLMVAETPEQVEVLKRKLEIEQSQGLEIELLDGDGARRIAPYLAPGILAALHCPKEGHSNPRLLAPAFARRAVDAGARVETHAAVTGVSRSGSGWRVSYENAAASEGVSSITTGAVLNAAGIWAVRVAAMANLHLPLFPVALTMNATEKVDPLVPHLVQHVGRRLSLKQTDDGNLLIGGGWPSRMQQSAGQWTGSAPPELRMDSVVGNLRAGADVVPQVAGLRLLRVWTGTTAITPDELPVLGEVPQAPGFFVAAGGSGFTNGPTYARLMSELILNGSSSHPLDPFSPARFGGLNAFMG
ncbi:NAD(P)/FAD-dependent oxidoreductase [Elongatibacter sediminis]|uniref:FAD-dependent oxidoreductase n=1 Tax=Elongatibacter sediminis TaxID=3119006 RepID=A0AAW9RF30_9GAMM